MQENRLLDATFGIPDWILVVRRVDCLEGDLPCAWCLVLYWIVIQVQ